MAKSSTTTRLRAIGLPSQPSNGVAGDEDAPVALAVFVMTTMLAFLAVLVLGVVFGLRTIESNLESRALALLEANGQTEIEVSASGLDLHVSGIVHENRLVARVPEFLQASLGEARTVTADLRVVLVHDARDVSAPSEPIVVRWEGSTAAVSGTVSDDPTRASITEALDGVFGDIDSSDLAVETGVASEREWLPTVLTLVREVHDLVPVAEVLANPNAGLVSVSAELETRQERSDVRSVIDEVLGSITFDFVSGLTVVDVEPPPPEEQVVELQENLDDLIEGKVVEFEDDSAVITSRGRALLDEILVALRRFPDVPVEIGGHTDNRGSVEYNLDLSRRRAESVLAYLVADGEDPGRFVVVGYGEAKPIADNATLEGQARNRRIQFTALKE